MFPTLSPHLSSGKLSGGQTESKRLRSDWQGIKCRLLEEAACSHLGLTKGQKWSLGEKGQNLKWSPLQLSWWIALAWPDG